MPRYIFLYFQDTDSEMERLQRDMNAILEQGENYAREVENTDPDRSARIRKQMDNLKVRHSSEILKIDVSPLIVWRPTT